MDQRRKTSDLLCEIENLLEKNDGVSRKQAAQLSRVLTLELETPEDTAVQLSFMVSGAASNLYFPLSTEYC